MSDGTGNVESIELQSMDIPPPPYPHDEPETVTEPPTTETPATDHPTTDHDTAQLAPVLPTPTEPNEPPAQQGNSTARTGHATARNLIIGTGLGLAVGFTAGFLSGANVGENVKSQTPNTVTETRTSTTTKVITSPPTGSRPPSVSVSKGTTQTPSLTYVRSTSTTTGGGSEANEEIHD